MVARILVAVLLSLAGAPVLQADSRSDYCESARLASLAHDLWAKELPGARDTRTRELFRSAIEHQRTVKRPVHERVCNPQDANFDTFWGDGPAVALELSILHQHLKQLEKLTDIRDGLRVKGMSARTLALLFEARVYATRAFDRALREGLDRESGDRR